MDYAPVHRGREKTDQEQGMAASPPPTQPRTQPHELLDRKGRRPSALTLTSTGRLRWVGSALRSPLGRRDARNLGILDH
jgi:hypothetical protein